MNCVCPICGREYSKQDVEKIQIAMYDDNSDPVIESMGDGPQCQLMNIESFVTLDCNHTFKRDAFEDYEELIRKHLVCKRKTERNGVVGDAAEHYIEDVLEPAIEQLEARLRKNAYMKHPETGDFRDVDRASA